jgi:hypothetical protein
VIARLAAAALALFASAAIAAPASAQMATSVRTVRTYVKQLHGYTVPTPVTGPAMAKLAHAGGQPQTMPIAQLVGILTQCRQGAMRVGGALAYPGKTVGVQHFECLAADAPDKILEVQLVLSSDQASVDTVDVKLGGQMSWLPPASNPQGWKPPYSMEKLDGYRVTATAVVGALSRGEPIPATMRQAQVPVQLADYVVGKPGDISLERAGEIVRPCQIDFVQMASVQLDAGKPELDAVRVFMKCGTGSSAPDDLVVFIAFVEGKAAAMQVQPWQDYQIPPAAAAGK